MLWAANTSLALNFPTAREYKPKEAGTNNTLPASFNESRLGFGDTGVFLPPQAFARKKRPQRAIPRPHKKVAPCERPPRPRRSPQPHPLPPRRSPCRPRHQDRFQKIGGGLVLPVEKKRFGCGNVQKYTELTKTKRKIRQEFSGGGYNCLNY